ncbi:SH3 domain-containing protein [Phenylobacterium soli]|uniref:Peptidoglycan-binding protein n=1 Tax=Phenylobacterium soli TaxID=2170551 RepID=A0A328AHG9_9CAUL|nr:SH3 domain-containing protein [Phenylobacterium soli]RAK54353.1 peptidoglycan-binding protein [Phenylobacterium soli]
MRKFSATAVALGLAASLAAVSPAAAQYGMDKKPPKNAATPELPRCATPLGRAAVREPERDWWTPLGLSNPEALLKLFAARSNCLRIVDRNAGLAMRNQEAALGASGDLRRGSNIGKGQVAGADFFIVPDIANSNSNSGGSNLGAIAGGLIGGRVGGLVGGLRTKSSEAQALITLVDARTTEQLYVAEGVAKKTDVGFEVGGGGGGWGGFAAAAGGGYSNTEIGKVISAAYFNAFIDLVHYMQSGSAPTGEQASQAAGTQGYHVTQATTVRVTPSPKAKAVRTVAVGDLLFPTGQKNGIWWEVDDENGNRGWVTSTTISPR